MRAFFHAVTDEFVLLVAFYGNVAGDGTNRTRIESAAEIKRGKPLGKAVVHRRG